MRGHLTNHLQGLRSGWRRTSLIQEVGEPLQLQNKSMEITNHLPSVSFFRVIEDESSEQL